MHNLTPRELAGFIDHTLLKPETAIEDITRICLEAKIHGFHSVCVSPYWGPYCKVRLRKARVKICSVVGFPFGATDARVKAYEARSAILSGANEIDMVINIGALKSDHTTLIGNEIKMVKIFSPGIVLKAIIETCLLTQGEIILACNIAKANGADFVKTSTGFNGQGATTDNIELMRYTVGPGFGVKASGGIRTYGDALAMLEAGASRLGCSASVEIIKEYKRAVYGPKEEEYAEKR